MWDLKRIYKDLMDSNRRREVLSCFWKFGEPHARLLATAQLAKLLHFRDETIRKMPAEKKADLLAGRIGASEFNEAIAVALMQYHTEVKAEMLAAFLDEWGIPHVNGSIEAEEYPTPTVEAVRQAVEKLKQFPREDVRLYLATAGLLMGEGWRESMWPVVDEMQG